MPVTKRSEVDIGLAVKAWLEKQGWTVYCEVRHGEIRADIIARKGHKLWVIECKQKRSQGLIQQARNWILFSNMTSVATWKRTRGDGGNFICLLRKFNMGHIEVDKTDFQCDEVIQPNGNDYQVSFRNCLLNTLREEHKTFAPPGSQGGSFTPENKMYRDIQELIAKAPEEGVTIDEILAHIRVPSTSKFGIFGRSDLARDGIIKAWKLQKLPGVTMLKVQKSRLNMKRITKVPTFFPNPKEVAA